MTAADLQDRIVALLVKRHGGSARRWRTALGPVRVLDAALHPHCNWSVTPGGAEGESARIEALLDDLRGEHPLIG